MSAIEGPSRFSLRMQIAEVKREIAMRQRVYPGLVFKGRMTQPQMEEHIACMEQVARTLSALIDDGK